ncbi:hypothetical protein ACQPW1_20440 [Nocardia sp. CA-128927]|uniref:hypothetical protein n=1 Tax=Nocardia sp. CA-128927 TaxID=3239975 RepID=UPI003D96F5F6
MDEVTNIIDKSKIAATAAKDSEAEPDDVDLANKAATAENDAVAAFAAALKVLKVPGVQIDTTKIALIKK